jgi:hypothetical protein
MIAGIPVKNPQQSRPRMPRMSAQRAFLLLPGGAP